MLSTEWLQTLSTAPWAALTLVNGRLVFGVALDVLGEPLVELFVGIE